MMSEVENKHYEFWSKVIDQLHSRKTLRTEFIACVVGDWLWDVNPGGNGLGAKEIYETWGGIGKYHEWLLNTVSQKEKMLEKMGEYFDEHKKEIMELLGTDDIEYISDYSADIYYENLAGTVY